MQSKISTKTESSPFICCSGIDCKTGITLSLSLCDIQNIMANIVPFLFFLIQFEEDDSSLDTASFLRATESVVSAMTARMSNSLSLDSGDESSDVSDPTGPTIKKRLAPATTEIAAIQTRHNRAFRYVYDHSRFFI